MNARAHPLHVEEVSCPCQSGAPAVEAFQTRTRQYWRCPTCDLVFFSPRPSRTAITTFYRENYDASCGRLESGTNRLPIFHHLVKHLSEYRLPPGRLLDIGCGHGEFAALCAAKGWTCFGLELSREAAVHSGSRGITMLPSEWLDDAPSSIGSTERFDVISLINVLETVPDPAAVLRRVAKALSPNGLLLIRVSNGAFHLPLRKPIGWMGLQLNQAFHFFVYTPRAVHYHMRAVGLTPVSTRNSQLSLGPVYGSDRALRKAAWRVGGMGFRLVTQSAYCLSAGRAIWAPSFETIGKQSGESQVKS